MKCKYCGEPMMKSVYTPELFYCHPCDVWAKGEHKPTLQEFIAYKRASVGKDLDPWYNGYQAALSDVFNFLKENNNAEMP